MNVVLPEPMSKKIKSHKESLSYQIYDGASRSNYLINQMLGIKVLYPFEGYKISEITAQCDPYIFCNKVNKFCMRYAVKELLPREILANKIKLGNPSQSFSEILRTGNNGGKIAAYLSRAKSELVNVGELQRRLMSESRFDREEFLGLSLLIFEEILREKYGKKTRLAR